MKVPKPFATGIEVATDKWMRKVAGCPQEIR